MINRKKTPEKLVKVFATEAKHGRRTAERLQQSMDEHFRDPKRRDGRGRRSQDVRVVTRTLCHLIRATDYRNRQGLDPNRRREAAKLVKTACRGAPFDELIERARRLRGRVNKSGKARNERIEYGDSFSLDLSAGYSVERLNSIRKLAAAGRALDNCAKDNKFELHDSLREGDARFYGVRDGDSLIAMFEVGSGRIVEFLGPVNNDVRMPRDVLLELQRKLKVSGDDVDACLQTGAASIFAEDDADIRYPDHRGPEFTVGSRRMPRYLIWYRPDKIVLREPGRVRRGRTQVRRVKSRWSVFRWEDGNWDASHASSRDRLDGLMTRYPEIAKFANRSARRV